MREHAALRASLEVDHLQMALQMIDLRLRRAVQQWQHAGQNPQDAFRGLYIPDTEIDALLTRPLATSWAHGAVLPLEVERAFSVQSAQVDAEERAFTQRAQAHGQTPPLEHLRSAFSLSRFELLTLLLCIAPAIDLRYERIYAYLQDDVTKRRPTVNLALDLFSPPGISRLAQLAHFEPAAPLLRHRLIEMRKPRDVDQAPLLNHTLHIDDGLLAWLLGGYRSPSALAAHLTFVPQPRPTTNIAAEAQGWAATVSSRPIYLFHDADAVQQRDAAARLAYAAQRPLLALDMAGLLGEGRIDPEPALQLVLRDAQLTGAIPMLFGWDACLVDGAPPPGLLRRICAHPGTVIVAGQALWQPQHRTYDRRIVAIAFPIPDYVQRGELWRQHVGSSADDLDETIELLAGQFALTSAQIRDAAATARDTAARGGIPLGSAELLAAARAHSNPRLAHLAHKIDRRYTWDDIILPEDQLTLLQEIIDTVRGRAQVLDAWGVGDKLASSRGVTVLFAGPPGTGKTMAAEIIAAALGLDLYRIDLSTIVSKYIGETEKNIERIFREAEQSNAILFFDEADALFGKRSEVRDSHDRYANVEISYLLQRMEGYDGVTVLATNLRGNLDDAFPRRLQFAVNFPFPEADDRLRIWQTLFPASLPRHPDIDLLYLAERFRLAGGNIRNILVSAAYLAAADGGQVTMAHLLHGTRRELQKMGRLVREEDVTLQPSAPKDPLV